MEKLVYVLLGVIVLLQVFLLHRNKKLFASVLEIQETIEEIRATLIQS